MSKLSDCLGKSLLPKAYHADLLAAADAHALKLGTQAGHRRAVEEMLGKATEELHGLLGQLGMGPDAKQTAGPAGPAVTTPVEAAALSEKVELNELRQIREDRGKLGRLNAERLAELEAKQPAPSSAPAAGSGTTAKAKASPSEMPPKPTIASAVGKTPEQKAAAFKKQTAELEQWHRDFDAWEKSVPKQERLMFRNTSTDGVNTRVVVITPEPTGGFRATSFDKLGPTGHELYGTRAEALKGYARWERIAEAPFDLAGTRAVETPAAPPSEAQLKKLNDLAEYGTPSARKKAREQLAAIEKQKAKAEAASVEPDIEAVAAALKKAYPFNGINTASDNAAFISKAKRLLKPLGIEPDMVDLAYRRQLPSGDTGGRVRFASDQSILRGLVDADFVKLPVEPTLAPKAKVESPAAAVAKVAEHVEAVAEGKTAKPEPDLTTRTGPRAAKEIKSELVTRLEEAIAKASDLPKSYLESLATKENTKLTNPKEWGKLTEKHQQLIEKELADNAEALAAWKAQPTITIEIPGDGTFKILNTKEALGEVLKKAKRLDVSKPGKPQPGITQKAEKLGISAGPEWMTDKGRQPTPVDKVLSTLDQAKVDMGGQIHAFGILPATWNMAIDIAKSVIKAGRGAPAAIKAALDHIRAHFKGAWDEMGARAALERSLVGPVNYSTRSPLPDLQPYDVSRRIFTAPFGAERLFWVGKLFGPRGRALGPVEAALVTHAAETYGVGKSVASALGTELNGVVNKVFTVTAHGDMNVTPRSSGASLKQSDVLEALQRDPNSYKLTPQQRTVWDRVLQPLLKAREELVRKYDLANTLDADGNPLAYFPRIVTERPQMPKEPVPGGGSRVGARQGFQKERAFTTEREGWDKGYKYETDLEKRLVTTTERIYKAIADKRLIDNPDFASRSRAQLDADLKLYYAPDIAAGTMTVDKVRRIADGLENVGRVHQPGFQGRIFDEEMANALNKAFPNTEGRLREILMKGNNLIKGVKLGFDLGVGFIQGQPLFFRNPRIWAEAQWRALNAMVDPQVFPDYMRANVGPVRELAQLGSGVGKLQDMLAGLNKGELIGKVPGVGPLAQAFGRQFSTFLDVAKIELWKSLRETTPKEQWVQAAQALESIMQTARMESVGVGRNQAFIERAILLAPTYYRGAINLVASLAQPGVTGAQARRAIAAYAVGGVALYVGVSKIIGMSDDEIQKRMNPADGAFLKWQFGMKDGRQINVGFGGINRAFMKLAGDMTRTSIENPGNWASLSPEKNPIVRFLRAHAAPVPAAAWDAFSGHDYMGRATDLRTSVESLMPLVAAPYVSKTEKVPPRLIETAIGLTGLSEFGQTPLQYIRGKAGEFNRNAGVPSPTFHAEESPYSRLEWALRQEDYPKAAKAYQSLIHELKPLGNQTPQNMVRNHFMQMAETVPSFTGSVIREAKFRSSLTEQQRELYTMARQETRTLFRRFQTAKTLAESGK